MIDPDHARKIDPELANLSDEELQQVLNSLYELGHLIFDDWLERMGGSKYPIGVLHDISNGGKI